jgi:transcription elongation factor Elf1
MVTVDQSKTDLDTGIVCPHCGCRNMKAERTRRRRNRNSRTRKCRECGQRVRTEESIVQVLDDKSGTP